MSEETLAPVNDAVEEAAPDAEQGYFDEGWDDDGTHANEAEASSDIEMTDEELAEAEKDSAAEEETAPVDQQETEETGEESESPEKAEEVQTEGDEGTSDTSFVLKHLGEEKTVDRDEVIQLAQQGLDYPRIREKWDGVKDKVQAWKAMESFLSELAEGMGGDINRLIDETRTRVIMERAEAEGKTISAAEAARQAVQLRLQQQAPAEAKGPSGPENSAEAEEKPEQPESIGDAIQKFIKLYGDDAPKAEDIPQEVWDEAAKTGDLIGPYQKYQIRLLREENEKLQAASKREQLNKKNAERSAGSAKSAGTGTARDPFDDGWDAGGY